MPNVFGEKRTKELHIKLFNDRMIPLKDLLGDYERLLNVEALYKAVISESKDDKSTTSKLKVAEWFLIDREVINESKEEIRRKCNEAGSKGMALWKRFELSNKIADENPDQYPRLIQTYIFEHSWTFKTQQEMRDMCEDVGDGMCCEVICDLELQMRICNGELVDDLAKKDDKLSRVRVVKLRNGETGFFGGSVDYNGHVPPSSLRRCKFVPGDEIFYYTPYAFRRVLS